MKTLGRVFGMIVLVVLASSCATGGIAGEGNAGGGKIEIPVNVYQLPQQRVRAGDLKFDNSTERSTEGVEVGVLIAALGNLESDFDSLKTLSDGVRRIKNGVTGAEFARLIEAAAIQDDYYCSRAIIVSAKYLRHPTSPEDVASILEPISENDYYYRQAATALFSAMDKR